MLRVNGASDTVSRKPEAFIYGFSILSLGKGLMAYRGGALRSCAPLPQHPIESITFSCCCCCCVFFLTHHPAALGLPNGVYVSV